MSFSNGYPASSCCCYVSAVRKGEPVRRSVLRASSAFWLSPMRGGEKAAVAVVSSRSHVLKRPKVFYCALLLQRWNSWSGRAVFFKAAKYKQYLVSKVMSAHAQTFFKSQLLFGSSCTSSQDLEAWQLAIVVGDGMLSLGRLSFQSSALAWKGKPRD